MKDATIKVGGGIAQADGDNVQPVVVVAITNKLTQEHMAQYSLSVTEAIELGMRLLSTAHEVAKDADLYLFLRNQETARGMDAEAASALAGQSLTLMRAARSKKAEAPAVPN